MTTGSEPSTDLLSKLNPPQREAVINTDGPLLILAGAGSGKTRVITHRIAYLIADRGVAPYNILAVTFTNKAAGEMRERVEHLLRGLNLSSAPLISTFHSLSVRILRQNIEALKQDYTRSFTIYDQDDSARVVKACLKDAGYDEKQFPVRMVQSVISGSKNRGEGVDLFMTSAGYADEKRAAIANVFRMYEQRLNRNNALDFDDLLIKSVELLRTSAEVRERYNDKFKYILVDEYQDTNSLQFALIHYLTEKQQNICVVGDDDQSVYGWRGADITNILEFEKHFPTARTIRLEQNYRSTQNILDAAGAVVKFNLARKGKKLWTANPTGARIKYYQALDADIEARFAAAKIEEHLRSDRSARAAVLYRTNSQSRLFEEALRRARIDYNIVGGFSFYERMEVRDVISYLKLSLNPKDDIALLRVINSPARGIGKQTLDELERRAKKNGISLWEELESLTEKIEGFNPRALAALGRFRDVIIKLTNAAKSAAGSDSPVSEVVKAAIQDTGYVDALNAQATDQSEARVDNLQELVNAAVDYDNDGPEGLRDFIDHAALVSDTDQYRRDAPVTLMTMHSAKGLEFPIVFIAGLEQGLFPHPRSFDKDSNMEEERRLFYVAITRAERYLYVTHAMKRRVYGQELGSEPSMFLNEMPLELMEDVSRGPSWLSFARGPTPGGADQSTTEDRPARERTNYSGKTYNSVESVAEFFRQRGQNIKSASGGGSSAPVRKPSPSKAEGSSSIFEIKPGMHVRHSKYGRGLVLKREGVGESAKLTISFPGYGQKKLLEIYADLERV